MTTNEKNVAIAFMLGATIENWYPPNKLEHTTGDYLVFPTSLYEYLDENGKKKKYVWYPDNKKQHCDELLKFHSDANWQYEALQWIENLDLSDSHYSWEFRDQKYNNFNGYRTELEGNGCWIYLELTLDPPERVAMAEGANKKEAVFEALYQFSQYIKDYLVVSEN